MNPLLATDAPKALLALEDGTTFEGLSVGATGETFGELVFNTAMSGYQEVISDPSYAGQVVTFTYPQIGNYGVCPEDMQSDGVDLAGVVVCDMCHTPNNWRSIGSLPASLASRALTRARSRCVFAIPASCAARSPLRTLTRRASLPA